MKRQLCTPLFALLFSSISFAAEEVTAPPAEPTKVETSAPSPAASFDEFFQNGLKAYQAKDFEEARVDFEKALALEPQHAELRTNLGLAYFQLNQKGRAIAQFRQALALDPGLDTAQDALQYTWSKLEVKEIPRKLETFESLRQNVLQRFSLPLLLSLTLLLILISGWFLLTWLGKRRRAKKAEETPPEFSIWLGVSLTLAVAFMILSSLKAFDLTKPRGSILEKTSVKSGPSADGVVLFELYEGFEVLIREVQGDWVQVTYPGGSTGWIPRSALAAIDAINPH